MDFKRAGSQPSKKGPAEYLTGSIQELLDGVAVRRMEKVSDEQYRK
jgi:hypothetical protein